MASPKQAARELIEQLPDQASWNNILLVAHAYKATGPASASVRLISARPATKQERGFYENEPR